LSLRPQIALEKPSPRSYCSQETPSLTSVPETKIGGGIVTCIRGKEFDLWAAHCVRHYQKWMRREQGFQYDTRDENACEGACGKIFLTALSQLSIPSCIKSSEVALTLRAPFQRGTQAPQLWGIESSKGCGLVRSELAGCTNQINGVVTTSCFDLPPHPP
jgi:hypothetical protein